MAATLSAATNSKAKTRTRRAIVISVDDQRLNWPEREFVRQIGEKLYGKKREAEHG